MRPSRTPPRHASRPGRRVAACGVLAAGLLAWAVPGPAASQEAGGVRSRVLVLQDLRVYAGPTRETRAGVQIKNGGGVVVLQPSQIRLNAASLDDAYFQLRAGLGRGDGDGHAKLGGWCETNGLLGRAREQFVHALKVEPGRDDWRRTLRRVEGKLLAAAAPAAAAPRVHPLRAFAAGVEPILLARCGNAGCHGGPASAAAGASSATGGTFRLVTPSRSAATTRRNYAAALPHVGDGTPARSPLLTACRARPGRRGKPPFATAGGAANFRTLAAWAALAARTVPRRDAAVTPIVGVKPGDTDSPAPAVRPDAYDPHLFNRTFAAPPADTPVLPQEGAPGMTPAVPPENPNPAAAARGS